jgi:hypothetical protein
MNLRKPFLISFAVTLGLLSASLALAWTGPSASPPSSNASAPLNISTTGQIKSGAITATSLGAPTICLGASCISSWGSAGGTASQWTTSGTSIYYNTGTVSVGPFSIAQTGAITGVSGISDSAGARMDSGGGWFRTYGQTGWYNGTYSGGMYMTNTQVVSTYNGSSLNVTGNTLSFAGSNPTISSAGSYITIPYGIYVPGGAIYTAVPIYARGGIYNDTGSLLTIGGGTSGSTVVNGSLGVGTSPSYKLDVAGTSGAWATHIANTGSPSYGLYIQAGTGAGDYPLYINNAAASVNLAYITGAGAAHFTSTVTGSDVCTTAGKCLSAVPGGLPFGGGYGQYLAGGCPDPNYAGGSGCGCPAYAPTPLGIGTGTCSGSTCNIYVCY